jgi:nucleotide-binding universal stress UspA family protein
VFCRRFGDTYFRVPVVQARMYREILVPTDGSPATERALEHALDLADRYGARVHALYVVDPASYSTLEAGAQIVLEALETEGRTAVEAVAERCSEADVTAETHVRTGTPHRVIVDAAEDIEADLVVMATHGRRGVERYLLGSVTERVLRTCGVPVLSVRIDDDDGSEGAPDDEGATGGHGDGTDGA